jgi:hypothetical protein
MARIHHHLIDSDPTTSTSIPFHPSHHQARFFIVPTTTFTSFRGIEGGAVSLADSNTPLVHIQFRRHAGCPICHVHLRSIIKREGEFTPLGVSEIVIFHSTPEERKEQGAHELPPIPLASPTRPRTWTRSLARRGRELCRWLHVARSRRASQGVGIGNGWSCEGGEKTACTKPH